MSIDVRAYAIHESLPLVDVKVGIEVGGQARGR